jgi:hypothetical protein
MNKHQISRACAVAFALAVAAAMQPALAEQKTFPSPEAAMDALGAAIKASDDGALGVIFDPDFIEQIPPVGEDVRQRFLEGWEKSHKVTTEGDAKAVISVGTDGWTFPVPVMRQGKAWLFDIEAGEEEMRIRRIGRNELAAMNVVLAIADAEKEYAEQDLDGNGAPNYAKFILSSPGKKDGLYWESKDSEKASPLGPLAAEAHVEDIEPGSGYHGYHYKILTGQGKHAAGGAYDYMVNDNMIGGFAVIAWPVEYGNSGVMSFIVNHDGKVFEKDLGPETSGQVSSISSFDPDQTWKGVETDD